MEGNTDTYGWGKKFEQEGTEGTEIARERRLILVDVVIGWQA